METQESNSENYIVKYQAPWFTTKFPKIFASFAFAALGILFLLSIILFALSPSRDMQIFPRIIAITAVALPLVFVMFRFKKILMWVFPRKEIVFNEGGIYQRLSDGSLSKIERITVYKHLFKDISFLNVFINGRKSRYYLGFDSSYKLMRERAALLEIARKRQVTVSERKGFFLNYLCE